METVYDREANVLRFITGEASAQGSSLLDDPDVLIELDTHDGHGIVGLAVMGASAYLPLGKLGYDAEQDVLTFGVQVSDPDRVTENGDLVAYWQPDPESPGEFMDAVGAAVRNVSRHLGELATSVS